MRKMAKIPFSLLEDTEIRKPSKVGLAFIVLFIALFTLSVVFIALYVVERNKSEGSTSMQGQANGTVIPTSNTTNIPTHGPTPSNMTCNSPTCIISAADILNKLDQSTKPCDDFYQYSCGGFLEKTYIPDGKKSVDLFSAATDIIQYTLRDILQNEQLMLNYSEDSAVVKAFTFYKSCMDEISIKNAGMKPILDVIEKYGSWNITNRNWTGDSWELERILGRVLADLGVPAFLALDVSPSFFNTSELFIAIVGGKSGFDGMLVEKEEPHSRPLQKSLGVEGFWFYYMQLMSTVFKLFKSNATIEEVARIVLLELDFGKTKQTLDLNDVNAIKKNTKFMTVNELNNLTSYEFNWTVYFEEVLRGTNKSVSSDQKLMILLPDNIKKIVHWLTSKPKSLLANEIIWHIVMKLNDALPLAFRDAKAKFVKSLLGITTPRWKTCNKLTDDTFTFVTTLLYVNKHLPEDARKAAAEMFTEIKDQFIGGLEEQKWMDNATRVQASLKLRKMTKWIGFPEFIKDPNKLNKYYENVKVNESQLLQSMLSIVRDQVHKKIDKLGKPPERSSFTGPNLTPLTVNAFYARTLNAMTVLAGILQAPFYKDGRLNALNYGSLGMVVGHEITHGFDKHGSEYDENGNIRQWWTNKSHTNFVKRSKCLIDQYNNVTIFGYKVNGTHTLSENIADNGGLKYAYRAYQKWREIHGNEARLPALPFNNDQLFFIGFAQEWCAKYKKEYVKRLMENEHSLNPVRVRVPLHNFPEFSKAFGCPLPKKTCAVW